MVKLNGLIEKLKKGEQKSEKQTQIEVLQMIQKIEVVKLLDQRQKRHLVVHVLGLVEDMEKFGDQNKGDKEKATLIIQQYYRRAMVRRNFHINQPGFFSLKFSKAKLILTHKVIWLKVYISNKNINKLILAVIVLSLNNSQNPQQYHYSYRFQSEFDIKQSLFHKLKTQIFCWIYVHN